MLKGYYVYRGEEGTITVELRETDAYFIIRMLHNTGRWIDPPLDDVFRDTDKLMIRKDGSKHAVTFWEDGFCLYPFRVGVPFAFNSTDKQQVIKISKGEDNMVLGRFIGMLHGRYKVRIGTTGEYIDAFQFLTMYSELPEWSACIDNIRAEVIGGVNCLTITLFD